MKGKIISKRLSTIIITFFVLAVVCATSGCEKNNSNLSIGQSATFSDGLVVTVNNYETGNTKDLINKIMDNSHYPYDLISGEFDDDSYTMINITCENTGTDTLDLYNMTWYIKNSDGTSHYESNCARISDIGLRQDELYPGENVTGQIYIDSISSTAYVIYTDGDVDENVDEDLTTACWKLE